MSIDPRIPLMGNAPPQIDVMGTLGRIAQIKRMEAISQQEQQEMALKQQAAQEDAAFKQVMVEAQGDPEKALPRLMQINPARALAFQKLHGDIQKTSAETSAFTRTQKEDEAFKAVLTSASDLNAAMPELMKINPKRALEFQKLQREAQGTGDFSTETVESGDIMAFNKRTGKFEPTGQRAPAKATVGGSLESQMVAALEKELGRPLTGQELAEAHGRWGKADDRPINVHTGDSPLVAIVGPDGKPVLVPRSQAVGKTPASTRDSGGGRGVTSGDANRLADFNTSLDDVRVLRSAVSGNQSTGTKAAIGAALPNWVTEATGRGTSAKQKQAVIDRVKQVIGKALEGGVLRKEDEYKYTKILPTISDPPELVKSKLDGLESALTQRKSTLIDALDDAGYNTESYRSRGDAVKVPPGQVPADALLGNSLSVKAPNGKTYTFQTPAEAAAFKAKAGIP